MSVDINNESGVTVDEDTLRELAQYVIGQMEVHPLADLSMLLVDEAHMTNLHEKWMEEPGPTDVLSFPMDELRPHSIAGPHRTRGRDEDESEPVLLGDVVLCPPVAAAQAKQHGHSTQAELELLTVHGVLHLLGYDHADPEEEAEMFGLQNELLRDWRDERAAPDQTEDQTEDRAEDQVEDRVEGQAGDQAEDQAAGPPGAGEGREGQS